ncbi:hypothetical protein HAP47_0022425 [Bradyrhizobium sp. 41S5]|uniref:hypothetical protein n=1 Tax=Bradyrhizobium sp. 41S5 TaxID=1404443 RepID=UPI00156AAF3C|nr:hypothetical protein [Bradyrhizobium sp. 41S5]UFX42028.1 hypothetical protein HAP47_0022425 [Bradyrhizobium sp. 41S5]
MLFIWVRTLRKLRIAFVITPIVFGAIAGWDLISTDNRFRVATAILALAAGLIPAVYTALKLDEHIPTATRLAGEYKNLEIIFKDLGRIGPSKEIAWFEDEYRAARDRLQAANAEAYTAPESYFEKAKAKIEKGHYTFEDE